MKQLRTALAALLILTGAATATTATAAATNPVWTGERGDQPALGGNDALSYFNGKPLQGSPDFTHVHNGATFRFTTAANRDAFAANPERYMPRYGGHCAWAASEGRAAGGNPDVWMITEGQLLLNCSKDAEAKWLAGLPGTRTRADAWWAAQAK